MFVRAAIEAMDVCEEAKEQRYDPNNSILQALGRSGREEWLEGWCFLIESLLPALTLPVLLCWLKKWTK